MRRHKAAWTAATACVTAWKIAIPVPGIVFPEKAAVHARPASRGCATAIATRSKRVRSAPIAPQAIAAETASARGLKTAIFARKTVAHHLSAATAIAILVRIHVIAPTTAASILRAKRVSAPMAWITIVMVPLTARTSIVQMIRFALVGVAKEVLLAKKTVTAVPTGVTGGNANSGSFCNHCGLD
jgi:hypothetical protein